MIFTQQNGHCKPLPMGLGNRKGGDRKSLQTYGLCQLRKNS